jgi:CRISPR-associated endonuclease/helicase Cas3
LGCWEKLLIVDEVHACDAYMQTLLQGLLTAHAAAGGSAILLSATLPRAQRESLVKAFSRGLNGQAVGAECVDSEAYPLLTHLHDGDVDELAVRTRDSVHRWVNVQTTDSEEEIAVIIRDAVKQGQCVCWIRNTVRDAREACLRLVEQLPEFRVELFHARYAMSDRLDIEQCVLKHFGLDSTPDERQGRVLVATQVVEQSLDLDFDVLISDLAPIDLVIQRAGRLHRHRRDGQGRRTDGPDERSEPVLYLYTPPWTDSPGTRRLRDALPGTAAVYREMDGQLWLGLRLLRKAGGFHMPENARYLIESVYGEEALAEIPDALQESALAEEGGRMAQRSQAELNLLNIEAGFQQEENTIWWDEAVTPTRLGEESVTVYLARYENGAIVPWVDGGRYAWTRSAVSMRKALIAGEGNSADISQELLDTTLELLPAKGKWGVLLPMLRQAGSDTWSGSVKNASGDECEIYYEREAGLMMGKEWREMEKADEPDI